MLCVCLVDGCFLEEQSSHASHFTLFLDEDLKVLIYDGHSQEDTRAGADGAQEVGHDGQTSYAQAPEGSSRRNVPRREIQVDTHGIGREFKCKKQ